ncbi:UTP--glucose-1-phosphate uridylyltransferase [Sulfobacillus thermosulfidooxidans]|uniref:UTP--glucose-1-phosphate uridylyltransferase n=2 Tax=Sulfobacillus thermosulfidooxidans TaxID=28034 RepID=A0A1R0IVT3_SULTH|nr:UTP--glucose-1-phosphate uridylyltransferase GalU [Sulfobacillus thermosulfidooxidans]OLZ09246.1 UTP--glucose-1-phosphate uridylyltransferase [Sulfobacillus thermosulfidooxidans]OLZ17811.1 UTP--glucose-1-phosphate uridylyltransferase [Sulfobacillus thermosulfidooxidans]OLZ22322.1 UTP--glucose-1-phosphate uridylyltransferase [Sulfobacillus thermosulfidooxidans]PSR28098.1 MAG: UTP--glucose-1-phosphate uridylyltransferase [Sulfobacillus thermosulfidooxidans]
MTVRKAVIPAAGLGTRFLPATKAQPKEMLSLIDKPTIQYIVEEAVSSGIDDLLVVIGRDKGSIEDHFDRAPELEEFLRKRGKTDLLEVVMGVSRLANLHFIRQKEPLGLGHAVLSARRHVGQEPFAVLLGDDVMQANPPVLKQLMNRWRPELSIVAVQPINREEANRYGIVYGNWTSDGTFKVSHLVEKPPVSEAPEKPLAIMGRYILDPAVFAVLEDINPGAGGEIQLTDALDVLARQGQLIAVPYQGKRFDVGEKLGFIKATVEAALDRDDLRDDVIAYLKNLVAQLQVEDPSL